VRWPSIRGLVKYLEMPLQARFTPAVASMKRGSNGDCVPECWRRAQKTIPGVYLRHRYRGISWRKPAADFHECAIWPRRPKPIGWACYNLFRCGYGRSFARGNKSG